MSSMILPLLAFALAFPGEAAASSSHGETGTSHDGSSLDAGGTMLPYLHFYGGDNLWFIGWVPRTAGAIIGTCIGLFLMAIFERWIGACRALMETHWKRRADQALLSSTSSLSIDKTPSSFKRALSAPFILAHDIPRGLIHMVQTLFGFAFMLAVMTFQAGFIIAIVLGLGVGETLFGRYATAAAHLH